MRSYRAAKLRNRRPFWLPASNYYVLASAAAIAAFFLVWGTMHDGGDETPFVPAGLVASLVLGITVILREIILRKVRNRYLASQRLDQTLRFAPVRQVGVRDPARLTLERNAAILNEITLKSEAAKVLGRLAESHREVFDLCEEYLAATARELPTVAVGSPRLAALRRGNAIVGEYHHYHLLQWAEIQSRTHTQEANNNAKMSEKLNSARQALGVVDFALKYYPEDPSLKESERFLRGIIASIHVSDYIEKAERASFKGNNKRAISLYKDALFHLGRGGAAENEHGRMAEKINQEIERLRRLPERQ